MSIQSEVSRLESAKSAIADAITAKGVTVPAETKLDGYAALIGQISGGGGGAYDITVTDNGDGTQRLAITDAAGDKAPNEIIKNMFLSQGKTFPIQRNTYADFALSDYPNYLGIAVYDAENNMQVLFFNDSHNINDMYELSTVSIEIHLPDGIAIMYTGNYDTAHVVFLSDATIDVMG